MSPAPKKATAVERLQGSSLNPTQLELMGDDIDLSSFSLALGSDDIDILEAVEDITVDRTIQGASTVTVVVADRYKKLLQSGRLSQRNDTEIDGLFFRLKAVDKSGTDITLTFEDREISILRTYDKPIKQALGTSRQQLTRAEFVLRMIREVKELQIPVFIPELTKVQPIGKAALLPSASSRAANRSFGISKTNDLTVKSLPMSEIQRRNANAILDTGVTHLVPLKESVVRKCLVMAIMCVIQESVLTNLTGGDLDSVGLFQQRASQGWPATRDIPLDAAAFFDSLKGKVQEYPNAQYWFVINAVQNSGSPTAYAQWRTEAERIVTAYGFVDSSAASYNNQWEAQTSTGDYEFYRGIPPTKNKTSWGKESSWDCIQRLAGEVNWRAFFVSGTFYYISEDALLKSQPIANLDESSDGVISIDGSYDEGAKSASLTLECFASKWAAPPGSVVQIENMGPWDGRWLVNDISRSIFSTQASVTLKKRLPRLPEPAGSNLNTVGQQANQNWGGTAQANTADTSGAKRGVPTGDARALAQQMVVFHDTGLWSDDNGRGLAQMRRVAAGQQLNGAQGPVFMDPGPIRAVVWLINQGYKIGTFAWCEDHSDDGINGHAGGKAVDISSINGIAINQDTDKCKKQVLEVDKLLKKGMNPRQLISGGYGNHRDLECSNCCVPGSDLYYGAETMAQHCNHIHFGV